MIVYSQNDIRWKNELLGFSKTSTIGLYGCYVTAFAQLATYYGKNVNPLEMNELFKKCNCFVNGSYLNASNVLSKVYPDIRYVETWWLDNVILTDEHINGIKWWLDRGYPVILKVKTKLGHYVLAIGWDNGIVIADPRDGKIKKLSAYGNEKEVILRVTIYQGQLQKMAYLSEGIVVDTENKFHPAIGLAEVIRMSEDRNKTLIRTTFPDGVLWEEWVDTNDLVVINVSKDLQKQIQELQGSINSISDKLRETEVELERAKRYWEDWKVKAGEYQETLKEIETTVTAIRVLVLQIDDLIKAE